MSLIVAEGITKRWTDKDVLHNVHFTLAPQQRVGLVGANGEGKTTLLRILVGLETPTEGKLQLRTGLRIGYLPQDVPAIQSSSIRQAMLEVFADLQELERQIHDLSGQLSQDHQDPKLLARLGEMQHEFESRGGYTYVNRIDQVLTGLNFPRELWDKPLTELSGGQRTRGFLARLLVQEPEVLLLDEPTNHLDLEAVEWLEGYLQSFSGALVIVSHDRYFLDAVTDMTWEISFAELDTYRGGYSQYAVKREERFKERMKLWEAQRIYIQETEEFIRRFLAGQRSKEAQGRRTRLQRFMKEEAIACPRAHSKISVRLKANQRVGDIAMHLDDLEVGYSPDKPLVQIQKLDILRGQRIAIVGPNGCGKTTLLRTILGQLKPLSGTMRPGSNVQLGYLSQIHSELKLQWTAMEALRQVDSSITEERARNMLGAMLLSGDDAYKTVSELSGGQRSRVALTRLMLQDANFLLLDEPTNHLDILSQEVLQEVLSEYDGTVLFVSHDRYLIRALATDMWAVHDGAVHTLRGSWEKYLQWRAANSQPGDTPAQVQAAKAEVKEDLKERRRRANEIQRMQRRLIEVEKTVEQLETDLARLQKEIDQASQAGQIDRITSLGEEYAAVGPRLQELLSEWEQLSLRLEESGE